jgi:protein quaking
MTTKQIENVTGCKIMIRGKGSMRDRKKEELNRGKPNWEHLNEELHVLITVEDTQNRATVRLKRAVDEVKKLLVPLPEGEDDLKKLQLMELAMINGTYRDTNAFQLIAAHNPVLMAGPPFSMSGAQLALPPMIRASDMMLAGPSGPAGAPIILAPRLPAGVHMTPTMSPVSGSVPSSPAPGVHSGNVPPQLVSIGGDVPPSYFVHFDPTYMTHPPPPMGPPHTHHNFMAAPTLEHSITYVR